MASYLLQVGYTPEAWANMVAKPQDRLEAVRPVIEKLGGKIVQGYYAFGEYDLVGFLEMPSNVDAAALSMAIAAGGACRAVKTTPLLSSADAVEALKKAGKSGYKAPARAAHA